MTNADSLNVDIQVVLSIKDAHIAELRHALMHVTKCECVCGDCGKIARSAIRHERWWENIESSMNERTHEIASQAQELHNQTH